MADSNQHSRDEWTLERALNFAAKQHEHWPDGPQTPDGRVPGVSYWVSTILADRIRKLEETLAVQRTHADAWRVADERAESNRARVRELEEQLERLEAEAESGSVSAKMLLESEAHVRELEEQYEGMKARFDSYEPGTVEGQVRAIWDLAEHHGQPEFSSEPAPYYLEKFISGLLEQYGTLHAAALALLESADDQTHPDDGFPIEEWLNLVDAVRGSNPASELKEGE